MIVFATQHGEDQIVDEITLVKAALPQNSFLLKS
jgi:hypothetical protein